MRKAKNTDEKLKSFLDSEKPFLDALGRIDTDEGWKRFSKETGARGKGGLSALSTWRPLAIAASIALLVALAFTIYYIVNQPDTELHTLSAADHNVTMEMFDGSMIFLKDGSVLEYPQKFNRRSREVMLTGEAYFEIMHDKDAPFTIHVGSHDVKVLGTSFNIRQEEERITVSVVKGKVSLSGAGEADKGIVLQEGEEGSVMIGEQIYHKENITSHNFLFWKTGRLSYTKVALRDVFNDIGSCYGVNIIAEDPEILQHELTTTFDNQGLDEILKELNLLFGLQFTERADSIFVKKNMQ
jgi:transmembrane sensor